MVKWRQLKVTEVRGGSRSDDKGMRKKEDPVLGKSYF